MKEIITLSLGPTSNFTSTHFWNLQDEIVKQLPDQPINDILYYQLPKSNTYAPRTIFVDYR